jgi:hypothetical protein
MANQFTFHLRIVHHDIPPADNILAFDAPNLETNTIDSLTLKGYHDICALHLGQYHDISTPAQEPVKAGAIISFSSELNQWVEIASLTEYEPECSSWSADLDVVGETTIEGWTRYFLHLPWCKFVLTEL